MSAIYQNKKNSRYLRYLELRIYPGHGLEQLKGCRYGFKSINQSRYSKNHKQCNENAIDLLSDFKFALYIKKNNLRRVTSSIVKTKSKC